MQTQTPVISPVGPVRLVGFDDRRRLSSIDAREAGLVIDDEVAQAIKQEALELIVSRRGHPIGPHNLECLFLPSGPEAVVTNEAEAREWAKANGWRLGTPTELVAVYRDGYLYQLFNWSVIKALGMVIQYYNGRHLMGVDCVALDSTNPIDDRMKLVPCQFREPPPDKSGDSYLLTRVAAV